MDEDIIIPDMEDATEQSPAPETQQEAPATTTVEASSSSSESSEQLVPAGELTHEEQQNMSLRNKPTVTESFSPGVDPEAARKRPNPADGVEDNVRSRIFKNLFNADYGEDDKKKDKKEDADSKTKQDTPPEEEGGEKPTTPDPAAPTTQEKAPVATVRKRPAGEGLYVPPAPDPSTEDHGVNTPVFEAVDEETMQFLTRNRILNDHIEGALEVLIHHGQRNPEKYGKAAKSVADFYKAEHEFVQGKLKDDPDYDPTEDEDYAKWRDANAPAITPKELRLLERQMYVDLASESARREVDAIKADLNRVKQAPEVDKKVESIKSQYGDNLLPENIRKAIEANPEDRELYSMELSVAKPIIDRFSSMAEDLTRISNGALRPQESKVIEAIKTHVTRMEETFINSGKSLVRDGKQFIQRKHLSRPDVDPTKVWTFSTEDVLLSMQKSAEHHVKKSIQAEYERLEKSGFVRKSAVPGSPPPATQERKESARTTEGAPTVGSGAKPDGNGTEVKKKGLFANLWGIEDE